MKIGVFWDQKTYPESAASFFTKETAVGPQSELSNDALCIIGAQEPALHIQSETFSYSYCISLVIHIVQTENSQDYSPRCPRQRKEPISRGQSARGGPFRRHAL